MRRGDLTLLWADPPTNPDLLPGEVHVWAADLDAGRGDAISLAATLSEEERLRAAQFLFERARRRFTVRRGLLRAIVGRYLGIPPAAVRFAYGLNGKPELAPQMPAGRLRFNLSDCDGLVLYALTRGGELGVDVERVRALPDAHEVAERFFAPAEREVLRRVPPSERATAFFNCWTRKESYIKAIGDGLSCPLDRFDVTVAPGDCPAVLHIAGDTAAAARWSIWHLRPADGYVGALAIEAAGLNLRCWRWPAS